MARDTMGQCQCCPRTAMVMTDTDAAAEEKESLTVPVGGAGAPSAASATSNKPHGPGGRQLSADSAVDSGHGSGDEASCSGGGSGGGGAAGGSEGGAGGGGGGGAGGMELTTGRSSHSSESSGRFSLRESVGSYVGDYYERPFHHHPGRIEECAIDLPVFAEECDGDADEDDVGVFTEAVPGGGDSLQPLQDVSRSRKISRGSSRGSRGSTSSERGSFSSVTSVTAILKARLGRSSSLTVPQEGVGESAEVMSTCSLATGESLQKPHRSVSLRLPRSLHRPHDSDTNLPTIYVDDSPQQSIGRRGQRKSSLQRALSLLSMNTLLKHHEAATNASARSSSTSSSQQKAQKPVQKILRQPRRRHNTVRGLSGLAIDASYQSFLPSGALHRSNTLYYPTNTSLRHATTRRAKSVTS